MTIFKTTIPVSLVVLLGSVALDLLLGEPPELLHPVVWIGRLISVLKRRFERFERKKIFGALLVLLVVVTTGGAGYLVARFSVALWWPLELVAGIYLVKSTFSIRSLVGTTRSIGRTIEENPEDARDRLLALVGRDRSDLSPAEMRSAAIESLFENMVDSIISPLFYFYLGTLINLETGVAMALGFKALNTVDSMIGYKSDDLRDFGFPGARLDDLLNWIPARLSPLLISAASLSSLPVKSALVEGNNTPSPNSGWPMSAGSGALKVKLVKRSGYVLGSEFELPELGDVTRAVSLVVRAIGVYLLIVVAVIWCSI